MFTLKATTIGESTGVILPEEMIARLKVKKGDTLFVTELPGGYAITPYDADVARQVELGRQFTDEFGPTFRGLAE